MSKELDVAIEAAKAAGKILMQNFRKSKVVSKKTTRDIVTTADLESERTIVNIIKENFPEHDFLMEESGEQDQDSDYQWIIDPIDGTSVFAAGLTSFGISIALTFKSEPILGVTFKPFFKELFFAEKGKGAFLNNVRISVSSEEKLENSFINCDWGHKEGQHFITVLEKLLPLVRYIQMPGSAVVDLTNVACGRTQAFVHNDLRPWDLAAGALIVREAGGKLTNFNGEQWRLKDRTIIASNGLLHRKILKELNR